MAGVGEPHLIVCGASSPHTFSMRPSDAAALEGADVIFLIDERKETALAGPIAVSGWRRRPMGGEVPDWPGPEPHARPAGGAPRWAAGSCWTSSRG